MEIVRLVAQSRSQTGKGAARQMRRQGRLPAVLYGRGESIAVSVDEKDFARVQHTAMGGNTILNFELQGDAADPDPPAPPAGSRRQRGIRGASPGAVSSQSGVGSIAGAITDSRCPRAFRWRW